MRGMLKVPRVRIERKSADDENVISLSKGEIWIICQIVFSVLALMGLLVLILKVSSMWVEFLLFLLLLPLGLWIIVLCAFIALDKLKDDIGRIITRKN